jgi:hypothetical protein
MDSFRVPQEWKMYARYRSRNLMSGNTWSAPRVFVWMALFENQQIALAAWTREYQFYGY